MAKENAGLPEIGSAAGAKDYSKYFDFSNAKLIREEEGKTTYRINGRNIQINSAPSYKDEKKRGKEDVQVHRGFSIPEHMKSFGKGKFYTIRTYGCTYDTNA